MNDTSIVEQIFARKESGLDELSRKYARLYRGILGEMLDDPCDIDECANDVLLAVWNSIPPNRPAGLAAYICKIARRIATDRLRYNTRQKRNTGYTVALSELEECLPAEPESADGESGEESRQIREILSGFIRSLDPETEVLFVRRYMYLENVAELAKRFEMNENLVSVKLYRARKKLKKLLEKEGIQV
jgi:RNA polymerase sigma-70 factor (ECF subfamily)